MNEFVSSSLYFSFSLAFSSCVVSMCNARLCDIFPTTINDEREVSNESLLTIDVNANDF